MFAKWWHTETKPTFLHSTVNLCSGIFLCILRHVDVVKHMWTLANIWRYWVESNICNTSISRNIPASEFTFHNSYVILSIVIFWTELLLKQMLPKQVYTAPKLKSSLQKPDGHNHDLVDRYEISISQTKMDLSFLCRLLFSFWCHRQDN